MQPHPSFFNKIGSADIRPGGYLSQLLHGSEFFRFRILSAKSLGSDRSDALRGLRAVAPVSGSSGDLVDDVQTFRDLAEGSVLTVQMRGVLMHDEELASG